MYIVQIHIFTHPLLNSCKLPSLAVMRRFAISTVTLIVPVKQMSIIVFHAFADSRSVGDIKFPAALFIMMVGRPSWSTQLETASHTDIGSRTSQRTAKT